jgi:triosephosphate isomerase (TIM)
MPRNKLIAGNWKMFTTAQSGRELAAAVVKGCAGCAGVRVAVCPPFPFLNVVGEVVRGSAVALGAQNVYPANEGAFTGEVSPIMLKDVGCRYVIVGHSERRHVLGETDPFINSKVQVALNSGLDTILCVGETANQRKSGQTEAVLDGQLIGGLRGVSGDQAERLTIAYEPVWAIGTGVNAAPEQAQDVHLFIRRRCGDLLGPDVAANLTIQYGGSVKPENAESLLAQPDVDGFLVGGASLNADSFLAIVRTAVA